MTPTSTGRGSLYPRRDQSLPCPRTLANTDLGLQKGLRWFRTSRRGRKPQLCPSPRPRATPRRKPSPAPPATQDHGQQSHRPARHAPGRPSAGLSLKPTTDPSKRLGFLSYPVENAPIKHHESILPIPSAGVLQ